ncbi:MAG: NADPH:quinone reductase [Acidimicrobiales bacterium]
MRAAIYRSRGPAREVLEITELPDPEPGRGEVRVALDFAAVNPTDWKMRSAGPPLAGPWQIPGQDGAGHIDMVGPGVDPLRRGQRVWVYHAATGSSGSAAELVCVRDEQAVALPKGVSEELGAALGIPYITAHRCLFADGPVKGATVLVTGGGGRVGHAAIRLGGWGGAWIIATAGSEETRALARAAGAKSVLDYHSPTYSTDLAFATPGRVDRVVEVALGANLDAQLGALSPHAVISAYASEANDPTIPERRLMTANVTIHFVLVYNLTPAMLVQATSGITGALQAGAISAMPTQTFPLDEIAAAHDAVQAGAVGSVLIAVR